MRWYWKCMLSVVGVLGIFISSVSCLFAQGTVADVLDNRALPVVDPMNAVIAAVVMLGIGVFAYVKRHTRHGRRKNDLM